MSTNTELNQAITKLILGSISQQLPGLLIGKMGTLSVITTYAHYYNRLEFDNVSDVLFDYIANQSASMSNVDFANGLTGIAWGIEYLVQNGFMPGSGDMICGHLDAVIMQYDVKRVKDYSLDTGLLGIWHYVQARMKGNLLNNLPMPFDKDYLRDWVQVIRDSSGRLQFDNVNISESGDILPSLAYQMNLSRFTHAQISDNSNNLSLLNGLAGYIIKKIYDTLNIY